MTEQQAIKRWKDKGVVRCEMEFSCGGDSMNDYEFKLFDKDGNEVDDAELKDYFEKVIWNKVQFYEASDGHYIGESGTVEITLSSEEEDADEDEEPYFNYYKNARSEWSETVENTIGVKLTPEQIAFIEKNVRNINGSQDDIAVNYKRDFILTDADVAIQESIENLVNDETEAFEPELDDDDDTLEDWYTFSTSIEDEEEEEESGELVIKNGELQVRVRNQYTTYSDPND